jgi:hypothetical protein
VVPEREGIGPRREQALGEARRDPSPVGGVLAVHDADVGAELGPQPAQPRLDRLAAGAADDVADEKELQGSATAAAG